MISVDANGEIVVTLGNADPNDEHLAGRIVAVDDEIVRWLARRERRMARVISHAARQQSAYR